MNPLDVGLLIILVLACGIVYATWRTPACIAAGVIAVLDVLLLLHVGPF